MKPRSEREELAKKRGWEVVQKPKGSAIIIFGGKKLADAVRKRAKS